jgi:hypothetical protein
MRLVRVTEIRGDRRFPKWVNGDYVVMLTPDVPAQLPDDDGGVINVPRTVVTFENGSAMSVQGTMDGVAARLNGVEET